MTFAQLHQSNLAPAARPAALLALGLADPTSPLSSRERRLLHEAGNGDGELAARAGDALRLDALTSLNARGLLGWRGARAEAGALMFHYALSGEGRRRLSRSAPRRA